MADARPFPADRTIPSAFQQWVRRMFSVSAPWVVAGVAHAQDPVRMAHAMRLALESGFHGARSGRIGRKLHASASSPWQGTIASTVIPGE